jgi:hypothetical protein
MNSATASSARLIKQRPFALFWLARLASTMGYQMLALTIGWQIYELTNSAFDLGLVGLIQFVPVPRTQQLWLLLKLQQPRRWLLQFLMSLPPSRRPFLFRSRERRC